jgi:hypothetical protein
LIIIGVNGLLMMMIFEEVVGEVLGRWRGSVVRGRTVTVEIEIYGRNCHHHNLVLHHDMLFLFLDLMCYVEVINFNSSLENEVIYKWQKRDQR